MREKAQVDYYPTIKDLPTGERPRERLREQGPGSLNNAELLAILLRVGTASENVVRMADRLLRKFGGFSGLARADFVDLCAEHGMGEAKTAQVKASLEIGRRLLTEGLERQAVVHSPADISDLLILEMGHLEQEHVRAVLLDTRNRVLDIPTIHKGSLNTSMVRIAEVFREAIRRNSAAVIVVHNHPSGDPAPSQEDVRLTEQIVQAGKILDIEVLDHLVIGQQSFISMREKGLGFR